jgi:hypothetical protein
MQKLELQKSSKIIIDKINNSFFLKPKSTQMPLIFSLGIFGPQFSML